MEFEQEATEETETVNANYKLQVANCKLQNDICRTSIISEALQVLSLFSLLPPVQKTRVLR
jgi:hypothetical protein